MKDIELFISEIISEFNKKESNINFEKFLYYVFQTFNEKNTKYSKSRSKDKYIKIRNSVLSYIVANKQNILKQIKTKR